AAPEQAFLDLTADAEGFCEKQTACRPDGRRNAGGGDLKAFEFAGREPADYREMLKRYAV
ncbi:hypothetical protein WJ030_002311, partial [Neisseria gonorrhoeae]